jgi:hypothetical protein
MIAMTTNTPPTAPQIMGPGATGGEVAPGTLLGDAGVDMIFEIAVVAEKGTVAVAINTNSLEFSWVIDT